MPFGYIGGHDYINERASVTLLHVRPRTHRLVWPAHHRTCVVEYAIPKRIGSAPLPRLLNLRSLTPR